MELEMYLNSINTYWKNIKNQLRATNNILTILKSLLSNLEK